MRTRLHHVALAVQDEERYERAVEFYQQVLGFPQLIPRCVLRAIVSTFASR